MLELKTNVITRSQFTSWNVAELGCIWSQMDGAEHERDSSEKKERLPDTSERLEEGIPSR